MTIAETLHHHDTIKQEIVRLRHHFSQGHTTSYSYRMHQLEGINRFLTECENDIEQALYQDLKKPAMEALFAEIAFVKTEVKHAKKRLAGWMKAKKVATTLVMQPGKSWIYPQPVGVVLIIAPWNYPIQLTLSPLIGALAAGNCAVIKPSELAPATSKLLATKLSNYIDPASLCVIEGGITETTALLDQRLDHIFFTGSTCVGKVVMTAAATHLTPVTLELGGKCPCIVDETADITVAARRIAWAKFSNAGQSCVAPDYILAHESIEESLAQEIKKCIQQFYSDNPEESADYGRIINSNHFHRLNNLLESNGEIFAGGKINEKTCYISPTILRKTQLNNMIMQEEIFGPILPIIEVKSVNDAIQIINSHEKPLAIYLFSKNQSAKDKIIEQTSSGGICLNHVMMQLAVPELPFGGIGASGMGAYHGKASFDTFSHYKSILSKPTWFDPSLLYPPYALRFKKLIQWFSN